MFPLVSLNMVNIINVVQFLKVMLRRNTLVRLRIITGIHYTANNDYNFFYDQIRHFFLSLLISNQYVQITNISMFNVIASDHLFEASLLFTGIEIE